jgi:uncharacterized repeat protein (TIGR03803 family)
MKRIAFIVSILAAVVFLLLGASSAAKASSSATPIYQFKSVADGQGPQGLVADSAGNLYGTSRLGGNQTCWQGCGIVYEIVAPTPAGGKWTKITLHAFNANASDGYSPTPTLLIDGQGNLWGTTSFGGPSNAGTIYKLRKPNTPGGLWLDSLIFNFQFANNGAGGYTPGALMFGAKGTLYGTTFQGAPNSGGLVYQLTPNGRTYTETVLHTFDRTLNSRPPGGHLTADNDGNLYGIRFGTDFCNFNNPIDCGLVWRLKQPTVTGGPWVYQILHRFEGFADGWFPNGDLTFDSSGHLFGTTSGGGGYTQGIMFELVPAKPGEQWNEYSDVNFGLHGDYVPYAGVTIGARGNFFGTTSGGTGNAGAVYRLIPPAVLGGVWKETVLYTFQGGQDGAWPNDHLIFGKDGALYGTTFAGGGGTCTYYAKGCGVVFRIAP